MRRFILISMTAILLLLCACSGETGRFFITMLPDDIEQVAVTHYLSGQETGWTLEGDALEEWKSWLAGRSARQKNFKEGSAPGDVDGGEVYSFAINDGEAGVSYVINGENDCYLLFAGAWYAVSNPTDPF